MTVAGPWSVKGIDPKAKELAKDLARRSGMTLGEWLNQMIIEGVGESEAPPFEEPVRDMPERRRLLDDLYNQATRRPQERAPEREPARRGPPAYGEAAGRRDDEELPRVTRTLEALSSRIEAAEHRSTLAISGIDQSVMGVLSRLDDLDREQTAVAARFEGAIDEVRDTQARVADRVRRMEQEDGSRVEALKSLESALGRLAAHLHEGGARAEAASTQAREELEALARRVNRVEAASEGNDSARADLDRTRSELETLTRRLGRVETEGGAETRAEVERTRGELDTLARRVSRVEAVSESAPSIYAAAGQTREELDGLVRRVARVEASADSEQTQEAFDSLGRRLARVEAATDAAPNAYADAEKVETVLLRMAERLERAEARTTSAVQSLESSFAGLDARLRTTEARVSRDGQIGADFERRFQSLASDLSQKVEASRTELAQKLRTAAEDRLGADGRLNGLETLLHDLAGQVDQAEKRSAQAIDRMGREVVSIAQTLGDRVAGAEARTSSAVDQMGGEMARIAQALGERVSATETRTTAAIDHMGGEMTRIADAMEGRLQRADTAQAAALEKLGGEIARIAERLTERLSSSDRRSAEALDEVTDKVGRLSETLGRRQDQAASELSDRIHQSEARTAKLLDEARERLDRTLEEGERRAEARLAQSQPPPPPLAYTPPTAQAPQAPAPNADPFTPPPEPDTVRSDPEPQADALHGGFAHPEFDHEASEAHAPDDTGLDIPVFKEAEFEDTRSDAGVEASPFDPSDEFEIFSPEPDSEFHHVDMAEPGPPAEAASAPPTEPMGFSVRDFQAAPVPEPSASSQSTRDMLEGARAAARRAAGGRNAGPPESVPIPTLDPAPSSGSRPFGITFPGRRKKEAGGPTLRTVFLASGWAAAITTASIGAYHISHDGAGGHAVAYPQLTRSPTASAAMSSGHSPAAAEKPELAVALTPELHADPVDKGEATKAAETAGAPDKTDTPESSPTTVQTSRSLYDNAVQRIEAGDLTGVQSLRRAANLGFGPAQFYLGRLYEAGGGGLSKNLAEARRWTERAAQSGEPAAMYNLASYLYSGEGGTKDASAAADWFHRAADRGVVNSQYNLAQLYEKGYGVPQNPAEAYKWYLVAAAAGDAEAKVSAEALRRKLPTEAQAAAERSAAILHAQAAGAVKTATASQPPVAAPTETPATVDH